MGRRGVHRDFLGSKSKLTLSSAAIQNCRERMYKDNSENRHPKGWISEMFSNYQIEKGFTESDELWNPNLEETFPLFRKRGRNVLDRIFAPENASIKCT